MGKIMYNGKPYSGSFDKAANISYDNSSSGLKAGSVQGAVDEVNEKTNKNESDIGVLNTKSLKIIKVENLTTSANGNLSYNFGKRVQVVSATAKRTDTIVLPFQSTEMDIYGNGNWWFHCCGVMADMAVVANTTLSLIITYYEV